MAPTARTNPAQDHDRAGRPRPSTTVPALAHPKCVEARTPMPDGTLIHAQLRLGTIDLMLADRLEGWPSRPGLLQMWVRDVAEVLDPARRHGAAVVTEPTPFYGATTLGRMIDPWDDVWWLWAPARPDPVPHWDGGTHRPGISRRRTGSPPGRPSPTRCRGCPTAARQASPPARRHGRPRHPGPAPPGPGAAGSGP